MIDIMSRMHDYLGPDYPSDRRVLTGGVQRHTIDGDTVRDCLKLLEPVTEDWHCLVCLLSVSAVCVCVCVCVCACVHVCVSENVQ